MSVSSSHGLTSSVTTDYIYQIQQVCGKVIGSTLAAGFVLRAFFALYSATRAALMRSASASSSSSEPNRSMSSSAASAAGAAADEAMKASPALLDPGSVPCSAAYDLM